ncbi:hypothetical protein JQC92_11660 [Shewanella sp. 202IG2-18]|uniref:hypothetical protein n=1 Tax=Parashewanella hymeniacidonis TaxID=2807618 RepID=UPI00195F6179|nr:hypothetical protein [Parashewanella hymeniacidonis]MBM7072678.1 hypothetical protein [Parashewanella hymeniacidonis]
MKRTWTLSTLMAFALLGCSEDTHNLSNNNNRPASQCSDEDMYRYDNRRLRDHNGIYKGIDSDSILTVDENDGLRIIDFGERFTADIGPVIGTNAEDLFVCGGNAYQFSNDEHIPKSLIDERSVVNVNFQNDQGTISGTLQDDFEDIGQSISHRFEKQNYFIELNELAGTYNEDDATLTISSNGRITGSGFDGVFEGCVLRGKLSLEDIDYGFYRGAIEFMNCKHAVHDAPLVYVEGQGSSVFVFGYRTDSGRKTVIDLATDRGYLFQKRF